MRIASAGIALSLLVSPAHSEDIRVMTWSQQQPGVLVLQGTIMSIVYRISGQGDFHVYQGERLKGDYVTLIFAKSEAERFYRELVEMGVQDEVGTRP